VGNVSELDGDDQVEIAIQSKPSSLDKTTISLAAEGCSSGDAGKK
jgi:hypothetical protein